MKMKYLLIAILLLGTCSAQYFSQEEVEASFENDLKDLDALTKDMDFDENFDFLEGAEDEEDPFDWEEEDDETCVPDERPHRSRRCHLAEYFDTEDGVEGTLTAPRVT